MSDNGSYKLVVDHTPMPVANREVSKPTNELIEHISKVVAEFPGNVTLIAVGAHEELAKLQARIGGARKSRGLLANVRLKIRPLPPSHEAAPSSGLWAQSKAEQLPLVEG